MSVLTKMLERMGMPKELLDYGQKLINSWKVEAAKLLPTPAELVTSIKGQDVFKQVYRNLTVEQKAGVDKILLAAATAALVKIKKVLGMP
jgi:hypothetical protein